MREALFKALFLKRFYQGEELRDVQSELLKNEKNLLFEDENNRAEDLTEEEQDKIKASLEELESHIEEIDQQISSLSKGWDFNRIHTVDLSILRLAIYEILYREDIPRKVSIDQAVELAKKFGTADSSRFINGILDKIGTDKQ